VEVEYTGSDLNADIQASYKKSAGGKSTTSMRVDLPANSRKEFFLYIYFPGGGYNWELNVSLLVGKRVLEQVKLPSNCFSSDNMIFGVLTGDPATFDVLSDVKPLNGNIRVAHLEVSDLPDRAQAWGSLDALIVSHSDTGPLTREQQQALQSWIATGGKLLVTGGMGWQSNTAGLKDFMPVDLNTTSHVGSLSELQEYVKSLTRLDQEATLASGKVQAKAQVLLSQDGIPLIAQKSMGFGAIYFFAADPALRPLNTWDGMKDVYEHLLGPKKQVPSWASGDWYDYRANQALTTIPELGLPSVLYICGVLGLYILVIGPLNYFVLRRIKRRELAWVTIPALVIIFSCFAYTTGFSFRGGEPILNRLAVAQAWDGIDQAQVHGLVGIYSPIRAKYDLEASDQFMFQPFLNTDMNLQTGNNWTAQQEGSSMIMPDVPVEIGDMRSIAVEGNLPALNFSHDLVITLSKTRPLLTGSITNKSKYTLRDAMLVTSGNWTRLGTIAPGQTRTARVSLASNPNGPAFYTLGSMQILSLDYTDIETDRVAARRNALLDTVLSDSYGMNQGNWGVYLIGWVDEIDLPAGLQDRGFQAIDTLLYVQQVSPAVKIEPGEVQLPTSMFLWESSTPSSSPYVTRGIAPGGYILRFQPAVPISFHTVKSMDLYISTSGSYQDLFASAWDYELKRWVRIPLTGAHTNITEADRYIGPDGEIKIRITSNQSNNEELAASNISLVVEP
jgi:hypothetical protein